MKTRHHISVFYSREDKCYIADIPDIKSCSAHGNPPEEAFEQVLIAHELWLESARASRRRAPQPKYRPAAYALV